MIVGIDIGVKGALALLDGKEVIEIIDMPDFKTKEGLKTIAYFVMGKVVYVEEPFSLPNQNNVLTNQYFGLVLSQCIAFAKEVHRVSPKQWTNHYGVGSDKKKHLTKAKKYFPLAPIGRHDRADALLIARYGQYLEKIKIKINS